MVAAAALRDLRPLGLEGDPAHLAGARHTRPPNSPAAPAGAPATHFGRIARRERVPTLGGDDRSRLALRAGVARAPAEPRTGRAPGQREPLPALRAGPGLRAVVLREPGDATPRPAEPPAPASDDVRRDREVRAALLADPFDPGPPRPLRHHAPILQQNITLSLEEVSRDCRDGPISVALGQGRSGTAGRHEEAPNGRAGKLDPKGANDEHPARGAHLCSGYSLGGQGTSANWPGRVHPATLPAS